MPVKTTLTGNDMNITLENVELDRTGASPVTATLQGLLDELACPGARWWSRQAST
jgi:hypothetical protein